MAATIRPWDKPHIIASQISDALPFLTKIGNTDSVVTLGILKNVANGLLGIDSAGNVAAPGAISASDITLSSITSTPKNLSTIINNLKTTILSTTLTGLNVTIATPATDADTLLVAIGKLQGQINAGSGGLISFNGRATPAAVLQLSDITTLIGAKNTASGFVGLDALGKALVGAASTATGTAILQSRATPADLAAVTYLSDLSAMFVGKDSNMTNASTLAPAQAVMSLIRPGFPGACFPNIASFFLSRYSTSGSASNTQLDVKLSSGNLDAASEGNNTPTILTLRSDKTVTAYNTFTSIMSGSGDQGLQFSAKDATDNLLQLNFGMQGSVASIASLKQGINYLPLNIRASLTNFTESPIRYRVSTGQPDFTSVAGNTVEMWNNTDSLNFRFKNSAGVISNIVLSGGTLTNLNDTALNTHTSATRSRLQYVGLDSSVKTAFDLYNVGGNVLTGASGVGLGIVDVTAVEKMLLLSTAAETNVYSTNFYANGNVFLQNGNTQYGMQKIAAGAGWGGSATYLNGGAALFGVSGVVLGSSLSGVQSWALRTTSTNDVECKASLSVSESITTPWVSIVAPNVAAHWMNITNANEQFKTDLLRETVGANQITFLRQTFTGSAGPITVLEHQKLGDSISTTFFRKTTFNHADGISLTNSGSASKTVGTLWSETSDGNAKNISGAANIDNIIARYKKLPFIDYKLTAAAVKKLNVDNNKQRVGLDVNAVCKIDGYQHCLIKTPIDEYNKMDKSPILDDAFALIQNLLLRVEYLEAKTLH